MLKSIIGRLILVGLIATPLAAIADDMQTVTAKGSAEIVGGDVDGAKQAALLAAKRAAVEQVGTEIISRTIVEDFNLVKDQIISRAKGFVHSVDILQEGKKGHNYVVQIKASVSASQIVDQAEMLYRDMGKPRIMVIVPQVANNDAQTTRAIETRVLSYFRKKGFEIVDASTARGNIKKDEARLIAEGDKKAAAKVALRSGAEVVILGDASTGKPESIMGELYSANANVSLRAIQASNAKILAAESVMEKAVQGSAALAVQTALQKATMKAESQVFSQIIKSWNNAALNGKRVELQVSGVKSFSILKKLKVVLQGIKGVTELQQRMFERPTALFDVTFRGSADRLAELLDGKQKGGITVRVIGLSAGKVIAKVR